MSAIIKEVYINKKKKGVIYQAPEKKLLFNFESIFPLIIKTTAILGIIFLVINFAPSILYAIESSRNDYGIQNYLLQTGMNTKRTPVSTYQPVLDTNLSEGEFLKIPSIGVNGIINEAPTNAYETALKQGVWRVPDFGTPDNRNEPLILVAHRFGYLFWSNTFRRENSFFNLPKLNEGDKIEITWEQRKYTYEVYKSSEGESISDYSADLILYTCKTLNTPVRIFKYAKLLEI